MRLSQFYSFWVKWKRWKVEVAVNEIGSSIFDCFNSVRPALNKRWASRISKLKQFSKRTNQVELEVVYFESKIYSSRN